jgi:hypothetical protein
MFRQFRLSNGALITLSIRAIARVSEGSAGQAIIHTDGVQLTLLDTYEKVNAILVNYGGR